MATSADDIKISKFIISDSDDSTRLKFVELEYLAPMGGGQSKADGSGIYRYIKNNQRVFVKSSNSYPADDIAEILTSGIFKKYIKDRTSAKFSECRFGIHPNGNRYVLSFGLPNWRSLNDCCAHDINYDYILKDTRLKKELSIILVLSYLFGDYDIHKNNIGFFLGDDGLVHIGKIDHGWAFASLFSDKYNLLDSISPINTSRGTHYIGPFPTNHFQDYSELYESSEFTNVAHILLKSGNIDLLGRCSHNVIRTIDNINDLLLLAQHIQIPDGKIPANVTPSELQSILSDNLHVIFQERAERLKQTIFPPKPVISGDPSTFVHFTTPEQAGSYDKKDDWCRIESPSSSCNDDHDWVKLSPTTKAR